MAIKVTRAGTTGNMVHAGVSADGYAVTDGMTAVSWNPQLPATVGANANDIVNLNVAVTVSGATITTEYGGGVALAGWAISVMMAGDTAHGPVGRTGGAGRRRHRGVHERPSSSPSRRASPSRSTTVQDDELDGGEAFTGTASEYTHTGLSLAGTVAADMIEVSYTTQTLKVYVHHPGDCASFAFVNAYTVDGQVWKNQVKMDDDVGFDDAKVVGVPGTDGHHGSGRRKEPCGRPRLLHRCREGRQGHGGHRRDASSSTSVSVADGVYKVGVPGGWQATAGTGGAKLPSEFLLEDELDADDHLNIDVTPTTGFLYGVVTDNNGLAAEGVTVDVNGESAVTDESGRYIVEGFSKRRPPREPILVTASGTGYTTKKDSSSRHSRRTRRRRTTSPSEALATSPRSAATSGCPAAERFRV